MGLHLDLPGGRAVLQGVLDEVQQHLQQLVRIGPHEVILPERDAGPAGVQVARKQPLGAREGLGQRQGAGAGGPEPHGEVLGEPREPLGLLEALPDEVLREVAGHVVLQRLQHAAQRRDGRAELVREHGGRLAQFRLAAAVLGDVLHDQRAQRAVAGGGAAQRAARDLQFQLPAAFEQGLQGVAAHDLQHRAARGPLLRHTPQPRGGGVHARDQPLARQQDRLRQRVDPVIGPAHGAASGVRGRHAPSVQGRMR